jgi:DNA polymerase I
MNKKGIVVDLSDQPDRIKELEAKVKPVFDELNTTGIFVDPEKHKALIGHTNNQLMNLENYFQDTFKPYCPQNDGGEIIFNFSSADDFLKVLKRMKVMVNDVVKGGTRPIKATHKDELSLLATSVIGNDETKYLANALVRYREHQHIATNWGEPLKKFLDKKNWLCATYNQCGADTGRSSTEKPNLAGVSEDVRPIFVGGKEEIVVSGDWDQCELRIIAHLSQDKKLLKAFKEGLDVHCYTAQEVFNKEVPYDETHPNFKYRKLAKAVNFGLAYGLGIEGLAVSLACSYAEASAIIQAHKKAFREAHWFLFEAGETALKTGEATTIMGRIKRFDRQNQDEGYIRRAGANMKIQGSAADMMKIALTRLHINRDSYGAKFKIWNTIYDEISVRAPWEQAAIVKTAISDAMHRAMTSMIPTIPSKVKTTALKNWSK